MRQWLLDVIAPSITEELSYFILENTGFVILLFVIVLVIAVSVFNIFVLKKNAKKPPEAADHTASESESESER